MNRFVFITHVTPAAKRNSLRQALLDTYYTALKNQTYTDWKVVQFGEEQEGEDGKFHRFNLPDVSRDEKTIVLQEIFRRNDFLALLNESDYLIKLDDDDIISPSLLEKLSAFKGDLFYDRQHTFVDVSSGIITQQERKWIASTCVHRTSHALAPWSGEGASAIGNLLYTDHSKAWHRYYSGKNTEAADFRHPIYARVLSPTSITSGSRNASGTFGDADLVAYHEYLRSFGAWSRAATHDFDHYLPSLADAWKQFSGRDQYPVSVRAKGSSFTNKLRAFKNRMTGKRENL